MQRTFVIAEAGVNHNGSLDMAISLVEAAAEAGADAVKFQTFKADKLVSKETAKAAYQQKNTCTDESQYEMLRKLELDAQAHRVLIGKCRELGIEFLSTPFDPDSVDLLVDGLDLSLLKIPSGEITNAPLLLKIARSFKPVYLSTGMSTLAEIEDALAVIAHGYSQPLQNACRNNFRKAFCSKTGQESLRKKVTLLHCTTEYPAPNDQINLKAMDTLRAAFGLRVGLSDHSEGICIPIAAVARGACVIEKHFTLDRSLPGPDHIASLDPPQLKEMIRSIRAVEQALGTGLKAPTVVECQNSEVVRKSLVAVTDIRQGELFNTENLGVKRPGNGISPFNYWDFLGRQAGRNYREDELI